MLNALASNLACTTIMILRTESGVPGRLFRESDSFVDILPVAARPFRCAMGAMRLGFLFRAADHLAD